MPWSAHTLIVRITLLELTISCWMWLVIFKTWLLRSQLPYKICSRKNQLFLFGASPVGPSWVPWAHGGIPVLGTDENNCRVLVMTRTYLLASPRGCPGQQTQRGKKKNKKPTTLFPLLPEGEPSPAIGWRSGSQRGALARQTAP